VVPRKKVGRPRTRAPEARKAIVTVEFATPEERRELQAWAATQQIDGKNVSGLGPLIAHLVREAYGKYRDSL
jgi:hypothetical protein